MFNPFSGRIIDVDSVLDPGSTWSTVESDDSNTKNVFDVTLHELGHHTNLDHSISLTYTMFFSGSGFRFDFNPLTWDDIAAANITYPMIGLEQITGTITGRVTCSGSPVFGAFVIAVGDEGALADNAITLPDGTHELRFVPTGNYTLYVEPLDGPTTPFNLGGGVFQDKDAFVTDFLPMFFNESQTPSVTVTPGATTSGIDFAVTQGNAIIEPLFTEAHSDLNALTRFSSEAAEVNQGVATNLAVGGPGIDQLLQDEGVFFLIDDLTIVDLAAEGTLVSSGDAVKIYELEVPLDTPQGEYPVFLQTNLELGVITGGLAARGRSTFSELRWYPPMEAAKGSLSWVFWAKQPESVRTGP